MEIKLSKDTKLSVIFDAIADGKKCALIIEDNVKPTTDFWSRIKHFSKSEFSCKCSGRYCNGFPVEPSEILVSFLDDLREYAQSPVVVSSGVRCKKHNASVGGVGNSYHMSGRAGDFAICGQSSQTTINLIKTLGYKPIEIYAIDDTYVHVAF